MLQTRIENWKKERKKEWFQEGKQDGLREGGVRSLRLLIKHRFGSAPDWAKTKLADADLETLEKWTERILDAESLDAVFHVPEKQS